LQVVAEGVRLLPEVLELVTMVALVVTAQHLPFQVAL
jgi:hypothetical protein